ncbi:hypothetical protein B566_EDAN002190 [Ephemera danica]|nr:hypothetical protein B566_EDAN002190 [Ephemera danica]
MIPMQNLQLSESPLNTLVDVLPTVCADPASWTAQHVAQWLQWMARQFALTPLDPAAFPTTGSELCALSRAEFESRAGPRAGSLLAVHLANLRHSATGRSPSPLGDLRLDPAPSTAADTIASPSSSGE